MALRKLHKIKKNYIINSQTNSESKWTKTTGKPKSGQSFYWLYQGQMMNDKYHGYGILTKVYKYKLKIQRKYYAGYWTNGKKHGFGGHWYDDGSHYEGNFYNDKRSNFGRMWHYDGSFYQGFWKKDLYNGKGILIYVNGNRYEGMFLDGKKEGCGKFYHVKTGQIQNGNWTSDVCVESVIIDSVIRQSALQPTPYPIPLLK